MIKNLVLGFLLICIVRCTPSNSNEIGQGLIVYFNAIGNYSGYCGTMDFTTNELISPEIGTTRIVAVNSEFISLVSTCANFDQRKLAVIAAGSEKIDFRSDDDVFPSIELTYFSIQDSIVILANELESGNFFGGGHVN